MWLSCTCKKQRSKYGLITPLVLIWVLYPEVQMYVSVALLFLLFFSLNEIISLFSDTTFKREKIHPPANVKDSLMCLERQRSVWLLGITCGIGVKWLISHLGLKSTSPLCPSRSGSPSNDTFLFLESVSVFSSCLSPSASYLSPVTHLSSPTTPKAYFWFLLSCFASTRLISTWSLAVEGKAASMCHVFAVCIWGFWVWISSLYQIKKVNSFHF